MLYVTNTDLEETYEINISSYRSFDSPDSYEHLISINSMNFSQEQITAWFGEVEGKVREKKIRKEMLEFEKEKIVPAFREAIQVLDNSESKDYEKKQIIESLGNLLESVNTTSLHSETIRKIHHKWSPMLVKISQSIME